MASGFIPAAMAQAGATDSAAAPAPASGQTTAPVPTKPLAQSTNSPIDAHARLRWLFVENLGVGSVVDDIGVGAVDTFFNTPKEYGPHWSGFGERIGIVSANYGLKSTMEVGLGSLWGEDPRYFRTDGLAFKSRLGYVIKMTFMARDKSGHLMPAYSRFVAFPASSFLSNAWQPTSESTATDAVVRVGLGFLSRMGENAWKEFIVPRK